MQRGLIRALTIVAALACMPARADPRPVITWITGDEPSTPAQPTFESAQLAYLQQHLPGFEHKLLTVSAARAEYELVHGPGRCGVGTLINAKRVKLLTFSNRSIPLPAYRLIIRRAKLPALAPFLKGDDEVDLDRLANSKDLMGGYTASRYYEPAIQAFISRPDHTPPLASQVATFQLFNLLRAERLDFAFILAIDLSLFRGGYVADDPLVLVPIRGVKPVIDAGISCTHDAIGVKAIAAINQALAHEESWHDFVEPMKSWFAPADFNKIASAKVHGVSQ